MARRKRRSNKAYQNTIKTTPKAKLVRYTAARVGRSNSRLNLRYNFTTTTLPIKTPRGVKPEGIGGPIIRRPLDPDNQPKRMRNCVKRPNPNVGGSKPKKQKGEVKERKYVTWCK
jgi:hypothetical protein